MSNGVLTKNGMIAMASTGGAFDTPEDNRHVFVEEIAGAPDMPEEFFGPYTVAAIIKNGVNFQGGTFSCVAQSVDKGNEAVQLWAETPDDIPDKQLIDYFFKFEDGKITGLTNVAHENTKNFSPRFIYSWAKKTDGIPNFNGTYIYSGPRVLQEKGSAEESVYPSDHSLSENAYKNATGITQTAFDNAIRYKIERYANVAKTIDSYKLAIWSGIGNGCVIGYPLGGNMGVQPQVPPAPGAEDGGHANWAFGFGKDSVFAIGSWGPDYGLKLYLKVIDHFKFGKIFVRGTPQDYAVMIPGVHQLNREWFNDRTIYTGAMLYDRKFPNPELEKRIAMERLVREKKTGRVFWLLNGEKLWVSPYLTYQSGRGRLWPDIPPDQVAVMPQEQLDLITDGGIHGRVSITDLVKYRLGL